MAMIFFMLALGCKESAVVFPALAAITFLLISKERRQPAAYLKMWPLWLLSAGYIAAWLWFIHASGYTMDKSPDPQWVQFYTSNLTDRILTSLATLPVYARLIVWPTGLHIERIFPSFLTLLLWQPMSGVLMAGLSLLLILRGRILALSFGLLWFAIALSPVTGIVLPIDAIISEGWMYMPTMGLFLGVAQTASGFFEKRKDAARLLAGALALSLGLTTFIQNGVWRNPETLYQNILSNGGDVERLSPSLGIFYMEQGKFDKAVEQLQYTVDHPVGRTGVAWAETHMQLAMAWLHIPPDKGGRTFTLDIHALPSDRHIPEAVGELGKALQDNPDFYWAHAALAALYRYQGNSQMAEFHDRKVRNILQGQADP
jgi:tetratricopeptide (TPR) repeat protein